MTLSRKVTILRVAGRFDLLSEEYHCEIGITVPTSPITNQNNRIIETNKSAKHNLAMHVFLYLFLDALQRAVYV